MFITFRKYWKYVNDIEIKLDKHQNLWMKSFAKKRKERESYRGCLGLIFTLFLD